MKLIQSATNFESLAGPSSAARVTARRPLARTKKETESAENSHSSIAVDKAANSLKTANMSKAGHTVKKRVRLKPESREQLLERLRNPPLSLHEAAILLRVSRATVRRYADAGRLPCQRTDGGQRRFCLRDIENFYRQLKLKR